MPKPDQTLSRNIRYLLWVDDKSREKWIHLFSAFIDGNHTSARRVLLGEESLKEDQLNQYSQSLERTPEELLYQDLLSESGISILSENLKFLFKRHGSQKEFQDRYGTNPSTTSKWTKGKHPPKPENQTQIKEFFGLDPLIDLMQFPIFLELEPLSNTQKRDWLKDAIDSLPKEDLISLYPALKKLLTQL